MSDFASLLARPASHRTGLLGLAGEAAAAERWAEALHFADRARRLNPTNATLAKLCAQLLTRLGRPGVVAAEGPALADLPEGAPSVLLITLARGGGVARHLEDRKAALAAEGRRVIELAPSPNARARGACRLTVAGAARRRGFRLPGGMTRLTTVLSRLGIERVEIHHMLGLDPGVLELPGRLGAPYDVYIHDYSWICPRITLMGGDGSYCGEPPVAACEACITVNGALNEEAITVTALRERSAALMAGAARVIAPTADTSRRIQRYFPGLEVTVTPWEGPVEMPAPPSQPRDPGDRTRVAVLGAIGEHKGFARLLAAAREARDRNLPLEFVVIGHTEDDHALFETGRVFVTGPYEESEADALLAREDCDVALAASVWPETWSYALTTLLRSGLPLVAFDIGALGERLRGVARARLIDVGAALNAALMDAAAPVQRISLRARGGTLVSEGEGWARWPDEDVWIEGFDVNLAVPEVVDARPLYAEGGGTGPLIGFALSLGSEAHSCDYAALFSSGLTAQAADGADCRSPLAGDPLVAIKVMVRRRG